MVRKVVPGVMVVVFSEDRTQVLLHRRDDGDLWSLPGGSAEFGESLMDLAHREVLEETGINITTPRVFGIYSHPDKFTFKYPDGNEVHSYVIGLSATKQFGTEKPNGIDSIEVRWFELTNLPSNLMSMQYEVVSDAANHQAIYIK